MHYFRMSFRYNKQSPQDFGLVFKNGHFFSCEDDSEWLPCYLYDFGWGKENGYVKLPLPSFEKLIQIVLNDTDKEDIYGAAAMISDRYMLQLKEYLLNELQQPMNSARKNKLQKLNCLFSLYKGNFLAHPDGSCGAHHDAFQE